MSWMMFGRLLVDSFESSLLDPSNFQFGCSGLLNYWPDYLGDWQETPSQATSDRWPVDRLRSRFSRLDCEYGYVDFAGHFPDYLNGLAYLESQQVFVLPLVGAW